MYKALLPILLSLAACGGDDGGDDTAATGTGTGTTTGTSATFDDATLAADLWDEIQGYEAWGRPAGWTDTPALSGNHMGAYVVRYDNDALLGWDWTGEAPAGAVSVKEEYADEAGATLNDLTVMKKVPGYDPANGDWFWAMYMPDGSVGMSGKVDMCYGCHAASTTDYLHTDPPTM